jgi:hypothetical protein
MDMPHEVPPAAPQRPSPLSAYFMILDGIQQQIRFADIKAGFIAALNAILFSSQAMHFDNALTLYAKPGSADSAFWCAVLFQSLYLMTMALAVGAVIWAVLPRFHELAPNGKVFFGQIARSYGNDYARYVRDTNSLTEQQWADEFGAQIVEISHIALTKHRMVRRAVWLTLLAFVMWRLSLTSIAYLQAAHAA